MKNLLIILSIIFFITINTKCQSAEILINSYNIKVSFFKSIPELKIKLVCDFQFKKNSETVLFILNDKCTINSIKLDSGIDWKNLQFSFIGEDSLSVILNENLSATKKHILVFDYSFPTGLYDDTSLVIDRGDRWYPLIMDQIVPFKLTCRVSKEMKVIAAGNLAEEKIEADTAVYTWESVQPVFKLPLIVFNPLRYKGSNYNNLVLYTFLEDSINTSLILNQASDAVNYFDSILGKLPFKNITIFETRDFNGVNIGSGLLMVGTQSLNAIVQGYSDLIIMPLAAEWFGAGVFSKYIEPGFFFLNISLPHYLRLMYIRYSLGDEAFNKSLMQLMDNYKEFAGKENDIPIIDIDFPNTKEKGLVIYAKGPYILSKLETAMGKTTWMDFIHNLYYSYQGKILSYEKFKEMLSHYDKNGRVLIDFNKMMSEKGLP